MTELALALRLEATFACLTAIWPGDMTPESERMCRRIVGRLDRHDPIDGVGSIVRDLWPRIRARALSGE